MEIISEIKSYLFCSTLEPAAVRSEMEIVLRCKNNVQVHALTVVDFTKQCFMQFVLHFSVGLLLPACLICCLFLPEKINKPSLSAHN